jgi:hypothetical protein
LGVGSNDKDATTSMRGTHLVGVQHTPFRIEPRRGQRPEYGLESKAEMAEYVLQHDDSRSKLLNGVQDVWPQVAGIAGSFSAPGAAEGLAWVPGREDVHPGDLGPVHRLDVAEVGSVREPGGEDLAHELVVVRHPHRAGAEERFHCQVQPAVARAQRTTGDVLIHACRLRRGRTAGCRLRVRDP